MAFIGYQDNFYYKVLDPNGIFLSSTDKRKAKNLIKNNRAVLVEKDAIKLNYFPNNTTHSLEPSELLINQCVVCGKKKNLTLHHILPQVFLKWQGSDMVVLTCDKCHQKYEQNFVDDFIAQLCSEYDVPSISNDVLDYAIKAAKTLDKRGKNIPYGAYGYLLINISDYLQKDVLELLWDDIKFVASLNTQRTACCQEIMKKVANKKSFANYWRQHFIEKMQPKFLPKFWNRFSAESY